MQEIKRERRLTMGIMGALTDGVFCEKLCR